MLNRNIRIFLIIGLGVMGFTIVVHVWYLCLIQPAKLSDLRWQAVPNTIAIQNAFRENQHGILFVRLKDGAEQFVAGKWETSPADSGNIYTFGEFPPNYSSQKGQQLYLIAGDEKIYDIEINKDDNYIISVQENHDTTYLLVEFKTEKGKIFCITERMADKNSDCEQINVGSKSKGLWNPNKNHEAVVKNEQAEIFTLDPWDPKLRHIDQDKDSEQYDELLTLFKKQDEYHVNMVKNKTFWKIANLAITKETNKGWSLYPIPLLAKIALLSDGEHLLIKEKNKLSILELSSHSLATVLQEKIGNKKIKFRNIGFDQTL